MRERSVAILADVHGNLPALEAVLADLAGTGVDEILVGGDLVGRGPQGSRVVERIRTLGWPAIRGNHEEYLLSFRRGEVPGEWAFAEEWAAARWMAEELGPADIDYISSLPFSLIPDYAPELLLVHGSPRSSNEGLGPWTSDQALAEHLAAAGRLVLACAHTHRPMVRRIASGLVVNVGSVGLPFNRDPRAQYAILRRDAAGRWDAELRQVPYEVAEILEVYESSGFLAAGGVTARLLHLELEHAAPFLVPFLRWAAVHGLPADADRLDGFLAEFDPAQPVGAFLARIEAHRLGER